MRLTHIGSYFYRAELEAIARIGSLASIRLGAQVVEPQIARMSTDIRALGARARSATRGGARAAVVREGWRGSESGRVLKPAPTRAALWLAPSRAAARAGRR